MVLTGVVGMVDSGPSKFQGPGPPKHTSNLTALQGRRLEPPKAHPLGDGIWALKPWLWRLVTSPKRPAFRVALGGHTA